METFGLLFISKNNWTTPCGGTVLGEPVLCNTMSENKCSHQLCSGSTADQILLLRSILNSNFKGWAGQPKFAFDLVFFHFGLLLVYYGTTPKILKCRNTSFTQQARL